MRHAGCVGIGVIYRKEACLSPAARRFIEILKTTAKEIAKEPRVVDRGSQTNIRGKIGL